MRLVDDLGVPLLLLLVEELLQLSPLDFLVKVCELVIYMIFQRGICLKAILFFDLLLCLFLFFDIDILEFTWDKDFKQEPSVLFKQDHTFKSKVVNEPMLLVCWSFYSLWTNFVVWRDVLSPANIIGQLRFI